jgi:predicted XRE-type DNA-binding protein
MRDWHVNLCEELSEKPTAAMNRFPWCHPEGHCSQNLRGMAKQAKSVNKIVASSGNVFADLGLPDAAELDTKVRLAVAVNRLLESRRLTQAAAATALSINQPKISALKHYKLEGFSVERLMTFLTALGSDIEIRVHLPKRSSLPGRILVNAA